MDKIAAINLILRSHKTNLVPSSLGQVTHAVVFDTLSSIHKGIADIVHESLRSTKPFTASNLIGAKKNGQMMEIKRGQQLAIRYTTLHPHMTAITFNGLIPLWLKHGISIHDQHMMVDDVQVDDIHSPWAGISTYYQLLDEAPIDRHVTMLFTSPTVFKRTGGYWVANPEPKRVFGSLIQRWNYFAPILMPPDLSELIEHCVTIEKQEIRTELARIKGRLSVKGFIGSVTFRINTSDFLMRKYVNTLASFAKFSGVGARTGVGLGQVRAA